MCVCDDCFQAAHLSLIDALMKAYASEIASVERVAQAVRWVIPCTRGGRGEGGAYSETTRVCRAKWSLEIVPAFCCPTFTRPLKFVLAPFSVCLIKEQ